MNLNKEDSLLLSAQDGSVIMTCEAKNENGEWQPIEAWHDSWFGNSYHYFMVPPMQAAYTKMIRYGGEFKTLCRLSLSTNRTVIYSNEIYLSINPSPFLVDEEKTTD